MGYIRHKALIVTGSDYNDSDYNDAVSKCQHFAEKQYENTDVPKGVVTPIYSGVNGYTSFAILPDGSKEWWDTSNDSDECVREIIKKIESYRDEDGEPSIHYAYVQLYDDNGVVELLESSKEAADGA